MSVIPPQLPRAISVIGSWLTLACSGSPSNTEPQLPPALNQAEIAGTSFSAATTFTPGMGTREILVTVTAKNTTANPVDLDFGQCAIQLLVFRTPDRAGTPAWDSNALDEVCTLVLLRETLQPGATHEFRRQLDTRDVAGSLPNGRYYFTVVFTISVGPTTNFKRLDLIAGDLELID